MEDLAEEPAVRGQPELQALQVKADLSVRAARQLRPARLAMAAMAATAERDSLRTPSALQAEMAAMAEAVETRVAALQVTVETLVRAVLDTAASPAPARTVRMAARAELVERVATTRLAQATEMAATAVAQVPPATVEAASTERNFHQMAATVVTAAIRARQVLVVPAAPVVTAEPLEQMAPLCHPVDTEATAVMDLLDSNRH